jgi:hypothetical protein
MRALSMFTGPNAWSSLRKVISRLFVCLLESLPLFAVDVLTFFDKAGMSLWKSRRSRLMPNTEELIEFLLSVRLDI